jgi:protein subunit release factor A
MFEQLQEIKAKYDELGSQLGDPVIASNPREYQKIAKEHGRLQALVDAYDEFQGGGGRARRERAARAGRGPGDAGDGA